MTTNHLSERSPSTSLCAMFQSSVERHGENVLVHHLGRDWTYSEIWTRALRLSVWLRRHGLKPGDRVGILLANSADYIVAYFGVLLARGVAVALNPTTTVRELSQTLAHCEPSAVITGPRSNKPFHEMAGQIKTLKTVVYQEAVAPNDVPVGCHHALLADIVDGPAEQLPVEAVDPSDVAQIIYTSGTTGRPKGVTLTHRNLSANSHSIVAYLRLESSDSIFVILPFFYSYGNSLLLTHMAVGGRLILAPDFVFWNRALDLMSREKATGFSGVPSSYAMLLHKSNIASCSFPALRYMTCAGGALAPATVDRIRKVVPGADIFLMYGQTEGSARLSSLMPEDVDEKIGSIGKGIPGVQISVLDEAGDPVPTGEVGEIVAQGENIMAGYWNDPDATSQVLHAKGLRTGDMARLDDDGFVFIVGRRSDMIKSGAHRINPKEVEEVILEMDGIVEAAVVGQEDDILGEVPVAFVVTSGVNGCPGADAILTHCERALPRYKRVRRVELVANLPKTSSGKIKRHELREMFLEPDMQCSTTESAK